MSALKQSILNVAVLVVAAVVGLGAYHAGSRIYHANQLYSAVTEVLENAKTLNDLNAVLAAQQQQLEQLKALQEQLDAEEESLEPDNK